MKTNLLYYSTNTKLAYFISENFYNSRHFVWCTPVFDPQILGRYDINSKIPGSSSPFKIYKQLSEDVSTCDKHSDKIKHNKAGLKKGAFIMRRDGIIDDNDLARIIKIIDSADFSEFTPFIYLIPAQLVSEKLVTVEVENAANPLSREFQIHNLSGLEFDIIEII